MDVSIGGRPQGRITFALYDGQAPRTTQNFLMLCTGEKGIGKTTKKPLHYRHSTFHRVIPGFMVQGGDFSEHNGTGGESIYGGKFEDEAFHFKHTRAGLLSMANAGQSLCGNQPVRRVLGDDTAVLAPSSGEEAASPRHRAGVASMAWRTTRRFSTNAAAALVATRGDAALRAPGLC